LAAASARTSWGSLQRSPRPISCTKGIGLRNGRGGGKQKAGGKRMVKEKGDKGIGKGKEKRG